MKKFLNLYSISFKIGDVDYGFYLQSMRIRKNVAGEHYADNVFIFDKQAYELINNILNEATLTISINTSDNYKIIYSTKGIVSRAFYKDEKIYLYFDTHEKINWMLKNGVSITTQMMDLKSSVKQFIEKVDSFYSHKNKTIFSINTEKNLNRFKYEALLFPIKKSNFDTLQEICKTYYLINMPFYIFLDDFDFVNSESPISVNVYDLSEIKTLRAVTISDLHTSSLPVLTHNDTYYDIKTVYNVEHMQKFNNSIYNYSYLKPQYRLDPSNRFKYNDVPDSESLAALRQENNKEFFSKAAHFFKYKIQDIDITKFLLGYRFVDDTSSAKIQYAQAIVDAEFIFSAAGKQDVLENKGNVNNQFTIFVNFTTITN